MVETRQIVNATIHHNTYKDKQSQWTKKMPTIYIIVSYVEITFVKYIGIFVWDKRGICFFLVQ